MYNNKNVVLTAGDAAEMPNLVILVFPNGKIDLVSVKDSLIGTNCFAPGTPSMDAMLFELSRQISARSFPAAIEGTLPFARGMSDNLLNAFLLTPESNAQK